LEAPSRNQITAEYAIQRITQIVLNGVATEDLANRRLLLAISIFSKLYIGSRSSQSNTFQAYGYNFMGLALNVDWGDLTSYTTNKFFCSNNNTPFLIFDGFDKNIEFLFNRWQPRMDVEKLPTTVGVQVGIDFITKFVIENGFNNKNEGVEFYNKIKQDGTLADYTKVVTEAYKLYDSIKIR
jgi:hypothetical protein